VETRAQEHKYTRVKVSFGLVPYALTTFALLLPVCLAGCHKTDKIETAAHSTRHLDTPAGMVEYLQKQNLPDLKSVETWDNKYGPGLKLTSTHYEIFTTLLEPLMLRSVPAFVEAAYRGYNSQLAEPIETKTKFTTYIFADRRQWEDFTETFAGEQAELFCKIQSGAYYINGACVTYNIGIERTFTALGHEGWHQFNSRLFKYRLPSWLDEGVATLFEAHRSEQETFCFKPDENVYRLEALEKTLLKKKMIPLWQLITINPSEVLSMDESEAVAAFYSQSYALVRFLREADYGKRLGRYRQLLLDGLRGNWPLDDKSETVAIDRNLPRTVGWNRVVGQLLFERYIGEDIDRIEKEYLLFCWTITHDSPAENKY
jgi:hypothetical protein